MDQTNGIALLVDPMTSQNGLIDAAAVETVIPQVGMILADAGCSRFHALFTSAVTGCPMIQPMDRDCSTLLRTAHAIDRKVDALDAKSQDIDDAMDTVSIADHDSATSFEMVPEVDQVTLISAAETGCRTLHDGAV